MGLTLKQLACEAGFPMAALLLAGILFLLPDLLYLKTDSRKTWNRWGTSKTAVGPEDYKDVEFVRLFEKTKCAITVDEKNRRVAVTLLRCSCKDFRRNRRPCIHMHRLAEMLDIQDD